MTWYGTILAFPLLMLTCQALWGQLPLLDRKVRLPDQEAPVEDILKEISRQGGFTFSYSNNISVGKVIRTDVREQTVRECLQQLFDTSDVKFIEKGSKILIVPAAPEQENKDLTQTIRGRVRDKDSKQSLLGVNIIVESDNHPIGTVTNEQGYFSLKNVPLGRHEIRISSMGYESITIPNVLTGSGKEVIMDIELKESVLEIGEVEIKYELDITRPINDMSVISSRQFSVEDTRGYPGAIDDPTRMALFFPGVIQNDNDGQSHIIVRGNSSKGLLWRLEGIEVPNLNHFGQLGGNGGGICMISNNLMANSDFFTGAFPAEYGNALSGVFDVHMRNGNNEKREYTFQLGLLGTELSAEGPFMKGHNATYLAQYRYSTFKIIKNLGIKLESVPDFQDLSFKIYLPAKRAGLFSVFGIGGKSHELDNGNREWGSDMGTVGLSHLYTLSGKTSLKTVLAYSVQRNYEEQNTTAGNFYDPVDFNVQTDVINSSTRLSVVLNSKLSTKHRVRSGIILNLMGYDTYSGWNSDSLYNRFIDPEHPLHSEVITYRMDWSDAKGVTGMLQAFSNWQYRISDGLVINTGVHFLQFYLNNHYSVEPRAGLLWELNEKHALSAGFGIHSKLESMTFYKANVLLHDGAVIRPNEYLDLTKACHLVLGYNYRIRDDMFFKCEAYDQHLYDVPVDPFDPHFYSALNYDYGYTTSILVNKGKGRNYGIEATLEKFFTGNYYFLLNGTLYNSTYTNIKGQEFSSRYNRNYAGNLIFRKEFTMPHRAPLSIFGVSTSCTWLGGMRYVPIDLGASIRNGQETYDLSQGYSDKTADYFRINLQLNYRRNKAHSTRVWRLDIMNLTNRKNERWPEFNGAAGKIQMKYQNLVIPYITYRIEF
jgi:hypothetical protein